MFTGRIVDIKPIRLITTGSMQKRFWLQEEVLILEEDDTTAKVIRDRLFNSNYADLDFKETKDGVTYLVSFFLANGITGYTLEERVEQLLSDGEPNEEYKGVL